MAVWAVFDGAEVELVFIGAMLGNVGQPDLVGGLATELTLDEIVVHRLAGSTVHSSITPKGNGVGPLLSSGLLAWETPKMAIRVVNEVVKPEEIRIGDTIQSGINTYKVAEEPKNTLMPKEGWPEGQSINPSHWVVYTFTDENGVPHSYRDDQRVTRQREVTARQQLSNNRLSAGSSHPKPEGRPRPNPRGYGGQ